MHTPITYSQRHPFTLIFVGENFSTLCSKKYFFQNYNMYKMLFEFQCSEFLTFRYELDFNEQKLTFKFFFLSFHCPLF